MVQLQADKPLLEKIKAGYNNDHTFSGDTVPAGVTYDDHTGLYYFADKICVPDSQNIRESLLYEYHHTAGHPSYQRTLSNISKTFWWPFMARTVQKFSDGATERVHRTIESILRGYCYNQHNSWLAHLSLAEFSYNNTKHASTGFSPFEVQYGYAPRTPAEFITPPGAEDPDILRNIKDIHSLVEENLKFAKAAQKHHADKRTKPLEFEVDDWVLLSTENLSLPSQPCKKLRQRFVGPYKIIEKISSQAYRLQLPADLKIHDVFHIRLLRKYDHDGASPPFSDVLPAHRAEIDNLDDLDYIKRILMHDIQFSPHLYKNGEALVFQVEWEEDRDISWEPFAKVFRTDEYAEYARSEFYQNFLASDSYKQLWAQYPYRGPKPPQPNLSVIEPVGV